MNMLLKIVLSNLFWITINPIKNQSKDKMIIVFIMKYNAISKIIVNNVVEVHCRIINPSLIIIVWNDVVLVILYVRHKVNFIIKNCANNYFQIYQSMIETLNRLLETIIRLLSMLIQKRIQLSLIIILTLILRLLRSLLMIITFTPKIVIITFKL